jgi:curved DNA-binding protein CbpA
MNLKIPLKNYYEILSLDPSCSSEEIKCAFRQQVALSHPDKVSHLSPEIQALASLRTAELTEAYTVLRNESRRSDYNRELEKVIRTGASTRGQEKEKRCANDHPETAVTEPEVSEFLRSMALERLESAVKQTLSGGARPMPMEGFDASYTNHRKWNVLSAGKRFAYLLALVLPCIDSSAVRDGWTRALKIGRMASGDIYLFFMGAKIGDANSLSSTILELQRQNHQKTEATLFAIPININSFNVLMPLNAPDLLRDIVKAMRMA